MESFLDFILLRNPNVWYVVIGGIFINATTAATGTFAYLRKRSLLGDGIAHSLLPGVCLGFLLTGEKNLIYLIGGAFFTGWLSTFLVDYIVAKSKIKQDAAIAIVLSSFFGLGIVLLTIIQSQQSGKNSGLDHFLFGQAAAISKDDLVVFAVLATVILSLILIFFKSFKVISFNPEYAQSIGMSVKFIEMLMTSLTVLSIAIGIQALGVVLVSALVFTPAAAARFWTDKLPILLLVSIAFAVLAGIFGAFVSYTSSGMPTGPWIVVGLFILMMISFLLAPKHGMILKYFNQRTLSFRIIDENILKAIYHFNEERNCQRSLDALITASDFIGIREFETNKLMKGLKRLQKKSFINKRGDNYLLTEEGKKESKRIVRLHRLWEQYLLHNTSIASDHVHSGAEAMEHILTPEIEQELIRELGIKGVPEQDL